MTSVGSERVIELGDMSGGGTGDTAAGAGRGAAWRRSVRRAAVMLLVVLCAVTLTGSGLPRPHGPRVVWRLPVTGQQGYTVLGESLYVQSPGGEFVAYDLADGSVRWASTAAGMSSAGVTLVGDVLLLAVRDDATRPEGSGDVGARLPDRVTAVDPRTGATLWQAAGGIATTVPGRALLVAPAGPDRDRAADSDPGSDRAAGSDPDRAAGPDRAADLGPGPDRAAGPDPERDADPGLGSDGDRAGGSAVLRMVSLADGRALWERPVVNGRYAPIGSDRLLTVAPGGGAQVVRLSDGAVTTTGRLAWPSGARDDNSEANLSVQGDTVYVSHFATGGRRAVTAYALGTLRERWRLEALDGNLQVDCGPVLCLSDTLSTVAHDPGTGEPRWRVAGQIVPWHGHPDRLLVGGARESFGHSLLDAATGRVLADLGPGRPVALDGPQVLYLRSTRAPAGRVSVSRLDPRTGQLSVTGTIGQAVIDGCQAAGTRLVCPHLDGTPTVIAVD